MGRYTLTALGSSHGTVVRSNLGVRNMWFRTYMFLCFTSNTSRYRNPRAYLGEDEYWGIDKTIWDDLYTLNGAPKWGAGVCGPGKTTPYYLLPTGESSMPDGVTFLPMPSELTLSDCISAFEAIYTGSAFSEEPPLLYLCAGNNEYFAGALDEFMSWLDTTSISYIYQVETGRWLYVADLFAYAFRVSGLF